MLLPRERDREKGTERERREIYRERKRESWNLNERVLECPRNKPREYNRYATSTVGYKRRWKFCAIRGCRAAAIELDDSHPSLTTNAAAVIRSLPYGIKRYPEIEYLLQNDFLLETGDRYWLFACLSVKQRERGRSDALR